METKRPGKEERRQTRLEYNRESFKTMLREKLGERCINCGSDKDVTYHHIVPIAWGGTNNLSNIIPLCHACHCAAHYGQHMMKYVDKSPNGGRPHKRSDEECARAFDLYCSGEIGTAKLKQLCGWKDGCKIADMVQFKRYKERKGITKMRNNVDIAFTNREQVNEGDMVGWVQYADGTDKILRWRDTGENDIEYTKKAQAR